MEGRLPPAPVRTRPEGILERLELAVRHLGPAAIELEKAQAAAGRHSRAASTQIRGARKHLQNTLEALGEAKRSLRSGTVPIADGFRR